MILECTMITLLKGVQVCGFTSLQWSLKRYYYKEEGLLKSLEI